MFRTEAEAVKSLVGDCLESVRSLSDDVTNCVRQISVCLQHIEGTTSRADRDETRSIRGTALVARQQVITLIIMSMILVTVSDFFHSECIFPSYLLRKYQVFCILPFYGEFNKL